mmetsp:Transcript_5734/g.12181  ORF Transcript_5734/g.12181 Transcript_5734/m.12181 type:complete len:631 (-) Transcript_5734:34-1926(-)
MASNSRLSVVLALTTVSASFLLYKLISSNNSHKTRDEDSNDVVVQVETSRSGSEGQSNSSKNDDAKEGDDVAIIIKDGDADFTPNDETCATIIIEEDVPEADAAATIAVEDSTASNNDDIPIDEKETTDVEEPPIISLSQLSDDNNGVIPSPTTDPSIATTSAISNVNTSHHDNDDIAKEAQPQKDVGTIISTKVVIAQNPPPQSTISVAAAETLPSPPKDYNQIKHYWKTQEEQHGFKAPQSKSPSVVGLSSLGGGNSKSSRSSGSLSDTTSASGGSGGEKMNSLNNDVAMNKEEVGVLPVVADTIPSVAAAVKKEEIATAVEEGNEKEVDITTVVAEQLNEDDKEKEEVADVVVNDVEADAVEDDNVVADNVEEDDAVEDDNVAASTTDSSSQVVVAKEEEEDVEKPTVEIEQVSAKDEIEDIIATAVEKSNDENLNTTVEGVEILSTATALASGKEEVNSTNNDDDACQSNPRNTQEEEEEEEDSQLIVPSASSSDSSGGSDDIDSGRSNSPNEEGYVKIVRSPCGEPMSESQFLSTEEEAKETEEEAVVKSATPGGETQIVGNDEAIGEAQPSQDKKSEDEPELLPPADEANANTSSNDATTEVKQRAQKKNNRKKKRKGNKGKKK